MLDPSRRRTTGQAGAATVGYVGLASLLAAMLAAAVLVGPGSVPGRDLAHHLVSTLICAADGARCRDRSLTDAYGAELARLLSRHAPTVRYQSGMAQVPVDFRHCLATPRCAFAAGAGEVAETRAGSPVTAFTRVVDRRAAGGSLYLQYWFYYPDSLTAGSSVPAVRRVAERTRLYHPHDWESYQVRIDSGGRVQARASAHHGHAYSATKVPFGDGARAWGPTTGALYVSGGSHAGAVERAPAFERAVSDVAEEIARGPGAPAAAWRKRRLPPRLTPAQRVRLVPAEQFERTTRSFGPVTAPWHKDVYRSPEAQETG